MDDADKIAAGLTDDDDNICDNCGDSFPFLDEATDLCEGCYEFIFGEPPDDEADFPPAPHRTGGER